ncbi:hypothetical protein [Pseudomonas sp. G5(2012)]|uniref:hypothetical protein n=1 Tax=Pseudomonas sp. G5(2012) TaxID=1268068 RepID=UPI00034327A7|nr:hypothetical protein [Pseudomonas sp. G5(2012)]EPA94926.1 hypothetical protein PG5_45720 [Pseudomonas sp. G5(2012)]
MSILARAVIGIATPLAIPESKNYILGSWPPKDDFPIVIDANGNIVSRFSDDVWDLWPWAGEKLKLNFVDTRDNGNKGTLLAENSALLKLIAAWLIYGPYSAISARSLARKIQTVKSFFKLVSNAGITATDLCKFPLVVESIIQALPYQVGAPLIGLMHQLLDDQEALGFTILNANHLKQFSIGLDKPTKAQTPYIPPRIWSYQANRLHEFIADFHRHRQQLVECFNFCIAAYIENFGSLEVACAPRKKTRSEGPFKKGTNKLIPHHKPKTFLNVAEKYGITELLKKWIIPEGHNLSDGSRGVSSLAAYFTMTNCVALGVILNHSMMRVEEGWNLRIGCFEEEIDDTFGSFYCIKGVTTKTIDDDDARWVTSPLVRSAVEAAETVSSLRVVCEESNLKRAGCETSNVPPYLFIRAQEPWGVGCSQSSIVRVRYPSYQAVITQYPKLLDTSSLIITDDDLKIARLLTPTLDSEPFAVGNTWPLAWHQLRRTGAVNMQSSGLVSDASMQYQLKHATRAMSLYYGRGYSSLRLNQSARDEYVRAMYEVLAREVEALLAPRFVSPYGEQHKSEILRLVSSGDMRKLEEAARKGHVSWRSTLLGGCTNKGYCEYGGVDNVARCGGGDGKPPCSELLIDKRKRPKIEQYLQVISTRLIEAPDFTPYKDSLEAQKRAVLTALNVIDSAEVIN